MIHLVQKTACFESAYPLSPYLARSVWRTFHLWNVCAPSPIRWGASALTALGVAWGGSDLPYPVFVTGGNIAVPVVECAFEYCLNDGRMFHHVARPLSR